MIGPVRFAAAIPEAKRLAGLFLTKKLAKVGTVIAVTDAAVLRRGQFEFIVGGTGRIAGAAAAFIIPRRPAFTSKTDQIASLFEQIRIDSKTCWKEAVVVTGSLKLPRKKAGQDAGPGRCALGVGGEGIAEDGPSRIKPSM